MSLQNKSKPFGGDKRVLRESFKASLQYHFKTQAPSRLSSLQANLDSNLLQFLLKQSGSWAGYRALPQEPDLSEIYLSATHITWAFPRVQSEDLQFHTGSSFVKGAFGILEPAADSPVVPLRQLQGVLVPGLGFDKKGRRLGRGRGFYDRALAGYRGLKIGVCFDCQVAAEDLPSEEHDVHMDALVTETEFIIIEAS